MGVISPKVTDPLLSDHHGCASDQIVTIEDRRCYNSLDSKDGKMGNQMPKQGLL
ncbi:hypothetical protein L8106_05970 [Lyngbya sp. PCC 8106]|nr:hypothetical protein L8106_05970 [Lyngbya sp. PCC 8106]